MNYMIVFISSNVNYQNKQEVLVRSPEGELLYKIMCIFYIMANKLNLKYTFHNSIKNLQFLRKNNKIHVKLTEKIQNVIKIYENVLNECRNRLHL